MNSAKYQNRRRKGSLVKREYPNYSKIDLSSPLRSHACSKRCVSCQATYPDHPIFDVSPCCDVTTTVIRKPPEMTWEDAKKAVLTSRFEKYYRRANQGINEEQQDYISEPLEINPKELEQALQEVLDEVEKLTSRNSL